MAHVLITGASGLIGSQLSYQFITQGHSVKHLGRTEKKVGNVQCYKWDINTGYIDERAFDKVDTVIHLAGAGIMDERWSDERKKEILDSRVKSGKMLIEQINKRKGQITLFMGSSAIGYYGAVTTNTPFTEQSPPGNDFIAHVCKEWEKSYDGLHEGCRKVIIRTGVVLSEAGGAYVKMRKIADWGLLSPLGTGKQYMPWIHLDDIVNVYYEMVLMPHYEGIYNGVSAQQVTNRDFCKALMHSIHKKMWAPRVPAFILKLMMGEMSVMVLEGSRVTPTRLNKDGFVYRYPSLKTALKYLNGEGLY